MTFHLFWKLHVLTLTNISLNKISRDISLLFQFLDSGAEILSYELLMIVQMFFEKYFT